MNSVSITFRLSDSELEKLQAIKGHIVAHRPEGIWVSSYRELETSAVLRYLVTSYSLLDPGKRKTRAGELRRRKTGSRSRGRKTRAGA